MYFSGKNGSCRRRWLGAALGICLACAGFELVAAGQRENASEDEVKAAYLLNFAKLGEWPRRALPDGAPLVIGVSGGDEEFLRVLKALAGGKMLGTHVLIVEPLTSKEDMKSCQIIFFRAPERKHSQAAIEGLGPAGVLLVGEDETFLRQGGMINLTRERGRIRFELNPDALDRSEIHFSAKILALAKAGSESPDATVSNPAVEGRRRLERSVSPEYPDVAERMKLTGTVQVQALVKADGTVAEVKVVGGHPLLADAVVRAVKEWKYQPGPKETVETVKFSFSPH